MADKQFDLVVLGSGPGGYVAAIRAAQLGLRTAIVERENLGGVCLNWGCIPTKALLRSAEMLHQMQHASSYGLHIEGTIAADLGAVVKRSRGVARQLNQGVAHLMKKNGIDIFMGAGLLKSARVVEVTGPDGTATITSEHIIIATGARARDLPFAPADGQRIWTYRHAMVPPEMPTRLLVIGSGAIGIEFASFYRDLGADVTIVEILDRIVPVEDEEVSAFLERALTSQGMTVLTSASVETLEANESAVAATIRTRDGKISTHTFSHTIVAIGIMPNTEALELDALGIEAIRGHINTDGLCRTSINGVWAIGDVTAPPWLAHKASHEGVIAAEAIAQVLGNKDVHPHPIDPKAIPGCTYCHPQIASMGFTEAGAKEAGRSVTVGKFPFMGNGKAIALGEPEGFIKTVFDAKSGELLGVHMIGAEVTELIHGFTIGKQAELVAEDYIRTVFPHPTLSEMMHESVLAAYDRAVHF